VKYLLVSTCKNKRYELSLSYWHRPVSRQARLDWILAFAGMTGGRGNITPIYNLILPLTAALLLAGCGVYSFTGRGVGGIKTIAIEPFENRTSEYGVRDQLSDALIGKLLSDKTLTLTSPGAADAILKGVIVSVDDRPLTFSSSEVVTENQVIITIEVSLTKSGAVEPVWQARLSGDGSYPYRTGSMEERDQGIKLALDRLVQDLINRLTSDW